MGICHQDSLIDTQASKPLTTLCSNRKRPGRSVCCSLGDLTALLDIVRRQYSTPCWPSLLLLTSHSLWIEILNCSAQSNLLLSPFPVHEQVQKKQLWKQRRSSMKMHKKNVQNYIYRRKGWWKDIEYEKENENSRGCMMSVNILMGVPCQRQCTFCAPIGLTSNNWLFV